jgi:Xaa-Pro aminopeptidase
MQAVSRSARAMEGQKQALNIGAEAIDHALAHVFERASVASEKDVLEAALRYGIGKLSVEQAKAAHYSEVGCRGKMLHYPSSARPRERHGRFCQGDARHFGPY